MYNVNDYVVYSMTGVCQIVDIETDTFNDEKSEFYVLKPVFSDNMTIKIPVANAQAKMRKTMSRDEAMTLIAAMPEQETEWIDDNRDRAQSFKAALRTGKSEEWVKLIKTIYLEKEEKFAAGKKLSKSDEDIFDAAEKQLHEELAIALGITPEEVVPFIHDHISNSK